MKIIIPDLNKILKPRFLHKPGFGFSSRGWFKVNSWEQETTPVDQRLLDKIGITKGDKILIIAGYYGDWACSLKKAGCKVDYSDVSPGIVKWVINNKKGFGKYICSSYELIPRKAKEYDWTFTFEACGAKQGLPIAFMRALLNNKGGKLTIYYKLGKHMGGKTKSYYLLIKTLAKVYDTDFSIKKIKLKAKIRGRYQILTLPHIIFTIKTNNNARENVSLDLRVLEYIKNKKTINLEKQATTLRIKESNLQTSLNRLKKISKLNGKRYKRQIEIK